MQTRNPLFDDIARLLTSAAGTFQGAREEVEAMISSRLERAVRDMDLVDRESFEVVRAMVSEARLENERLAQEVAELRSEIATIRSGGAAASES